ncbi:MAG: hypothetical protein DSM106950_30895 [Stigonema ocellatum SAG 48.90 = DSM 106950]|nr:hypothetical protein [Stigonema ocellatum SAG 48.90 = DSM 106950]
MYSTSNVWEELSDAQCEAVSGGLLFDFVSNPYYSATFYPASAGGGTVGTVANYDAPGVAYTPGSVIPTVVGTSTPGTVGFIPFY